MSDIRFKLSGTSSPFLAEIRCDGNDGPIIASQFVEHSTNHNDNYSCVIFSGLDANKENGFYYINVTDSIGEFTSYPAGTPSNPTEPEPTEVNIDLLGTRYENLSIEGNEILLNRNQDKYIDISPAPQGDECITVNLNAFTYSDLKSEAFIKLYKRNSPSSSYNLVDTIQDQGDDNSPVSQSIKIGEGERVCYEMYTRLSSEISFKIDRCACASLQLDSTSTSNYAYGANISCGNTGFDFSQFREANSLSTTDSTTEPPQSTALTINESIIYYSDAGYPKAIDVDGNYVYPTYVIEPSNVELTNSDVTVSPSYALAYNGLKVSQNNDGTGTIEVRLTTNSTNKTRDVTVTAYHPNDSSVYDDVTLRQDAIELTPS